MNVPVPPNPLPSLAQLKAKERVTIERGEVLEEVEQVLNGEIWAEVHQWLWSTAWLASHRRLRRIAPEDIEDVARESLLEVTRQIDRVKRVEDLPRFTQVIANSQAVMHWRKLMTKKRGEGKIVSTDEPMDDGQERPQHGDETPGLHQWDIKDIAELIERLSSEVKPEYIEAVRDFVGEELSYEEIHKKRGWAMGSIGVYIKRGLDAMRSERVGYQKVVEEAKNYFRLLFA